MASDGKNKKNGSKENDIPKLFNRELSWLDFNSRVLDEAEEKSLPVLDRLKFTAIFSSNLDEFFMVRVAGLRQQAKSGKKLVCPAGMTPDAQLAAIRGKVLEMTKRQAKLAKTLLAELAEKGGTKILQYEKLDETDKKTASAYFRDTVFPVLTPVAVDASHPFPTLKNCALEIAVALKRRSDGERVNALVETPEILPRLIPLETMNPDTRNRKACIMLEDLIINHLDDLFRGQKILDHLMFRITRDMDFELNEDMVADLLAHIEEELSSRVRRDFIRLEIEKGESTKLRRWLLDELKIEKNFLYETGTHLDLKFLMDLFKSPGNLRFLEEPWPVSMSPAISDGENVFEAIDREEFIPLFLPFQSFSPVVRLMEEAADDPNVLAIKQTLYRVSGDSPVVQALLKAARNGKQVTVIVEIKARFDEERNIAWAKRLEGAGAHVIYGIPKLKVHCKSLLIIRRNDAGAIDRYLHLSTGNYNDSTAKLYTDIGYMTNDADLCADAAALFNIMTGYSEFQDFNHMAAAPFNLRRSFLSLIARESRLSKPKAPGRIIAKMNSLVDPEIIEALYNATKRGVDIDLIVRGICCLNTEAAPGPGKIRVLSIIDRYLEHSRVYCFRNGGNEEFYLSSADWMPRNLDKRIESLFPVEDANTKKILAALFDFQLNDKARGRVMEKNGAYVKLTSKPESRSQKKTAEFFKKILPPSGQPGKLLKYRPAGK